MKSIRSKINPNCGNKVWLQIRESGFPFWLANEIRGNASIHFFDFPKNRLIEKMYASRIVWYSK